MFRPHFRRTPGPDRRMLLFGGVSVTKLAVGAALALSLSAGGVAGEVLLSSPVGAAKARPAPPAVGKNWATPGQNVQPSRNAGGPGLHERHLPVSVHPGRQPGFQANFSVAPANAAPALPKR